MAADITWVDLSRIGITMGSWKHPTDPAKSLPLAIVDANGTHDAQIRALGFEPAQGTKATGIYVRRDPAVSSAQLKDAFGKENVQFFKGPKEHFDRVFQKAFRDRAKVNASVALSQDTDIGMNHLGEVVRQTLQGRYVMRAADGQSKVVREGEGDASEFLRANTKEQLWDVAKGFVGRITWRGDTLRRQDVQALMELSNGAGFSAKQYEEAIEVALNDAFTKAVDVSSVNGLADPLAAYDAANRLYQGMPQLKERTANSVANQQYSTPTPMSAIAQALLDDYAAMAGKSFLDPTIGNGSLVSAIAAVRSQAPGTRIYGVEIDPARAEAAARVTDQLILADATSVNFKRDFAIDGGFDYIIANPPFGQMEQRQSVAFPANSLVASMDVQRLDHFLMLRSLNARTDAGRAVFITGADNALTPGVIKGRSQHVLNYLMDHYHVDGVVDVSGELYKKQGAAYPLRLYVIGARKAVPEPAEVPKELPVMQTYDALRKWAAKIIESRPALAVNDPVVAPTASPERPAETPRPRAARRAPAAPKTRTPVDISYKAVDGLFTAFYPETDAGRIAWNVIAADTDGTGKVLTQHAAGVIAQLRGQGYNVAVTREAPISDEELLSELTSDDSPLGTLDPLPPVEEVPAAPDASPVVAEVPVASTAEPRVDNREESHFQMRYIAFSNSGEPTTMMPSNLSGPVYEALADIKERHGDIDEFVANELQFEVGNLPNYFSPEQVDALSMMFSATSRNLGFLLADKMGVGKGRTLAGFARRERLQGRIPMFVTLTDSLFTDFLERDIAAIDSRHLFQNPMIVNDGAKTVDETGEVVARSMKRPEYRAAAEAGRLPEGTDIILLTYSQLARNHAVHLTSRYMRALCSSYPISLILDESHNGAGASNTSENLMGMIKGLDLHRGNVIYSSGTPIKGAKNLALYRKILPKGISPEELLDAVNSDPISLQEALNYEIAVQGCMISRELDDTGIEKEFVVSRYAARNEAIADQVSEILTGMNYMSGDVSKVVQEINKKFKKQLELIPEAERAGSRMGATSMNFSSRMHSLVCQMLLCLKSREIVDLAIEALENNEKPIIAIQRTGESLLNDFVSGRSANFDDKEKAGKRVQKTFSAMELDKPITFRDYLNRMLERLMWIQETTRYGEVSKHRVISEEVGEAEEHIKGLIDGLPDDLPLLPIDYFREELGKAGYSIAEVSGRNLRTRTLDNAKVVIEQIPNRGDKTRVQRACRDFNNGDVDVLVLTGAGSTGLSVQASPKVGADTRVRTMIKGEMQSDIARERQMDGRHNRTGQIEKPKYKIPMTGLPADDRLAMMFNSKNRSLSASTTANRDSKDIIRQVPELLNVVGDMVAQDWLMANREMAAELDVALPDDEDSVFMRGPLHYIKTLTGHAAMLRIETQRELYADLESRFFEQLDTLKAEGRNPLEVECHDWSAKLVHRQVFQGAKNTEAGSKSQLSKPVFLTTVEYEHEIKAVRASSVDDKIVKAQTSTPNVAFISNYLRDYGTAILNSTKGQKFETVEAALADKEPNKTQEMAGKLAWLETNLPLVRPGAVYSKRDLEGLQVPTVVVRVQVPDAPAAYARLGDYSIHVMQAGSEDVVVERLSSLYASDIDFEPWTFKDHEEARHAFDTAENGKVLKRARLLDGNLFDATALNLREHLGRKVVYTDDSNSRQHGILIYADITDKKLLSIPERLRDTALIEAYARQVPITTDSTGDWKKADESIVLGENGTAITIKVPGTKKRGGHIFLDPVLANIAGKEKDNVFGLEFRVINGQMVSTVARHQLGELVKYLVEVRNENFYTIDRDRLTRVREAMDKTKKLERQEEFPT